jgi:polyketide cyclase/dehydrase/lipid transport protein
MHLQAAIVVNRTTEHVWSFFSQLSNLAKWDRSVAQAIATSPEPFGVGSTFDTIAPVRKPRAGKEGLRMSYRVTEYVPTRRFKALLVHSPMFKYAEWSMTTEEVPEGVRITCQADLSVRLRYSFLIPVLLLTYQDAFRRDLTYLKQAIEQDQAAGLPLVADGVVG